MKKLYKNGGGGKRSMHNYVIILRNIKSKEEEYSSCLSVGSKHNRSTGI